jgi:hypothetical protein
MIEAGARMWIVEAERLATAPRVVPGAGRRIEIPSPEGWGFVSRLETPHPGAVYVSSLTRMNLAPGAEEGPARGLVLRAPEAGRYRVRVCADLAVDRAEELESGRQSVRWCGREFEWIAAE